MVHQNNYKQPLSQNEYSANIVESALPASLVSTVSARDRDTGKNGQIIYSINQILFWFHQVQNCWETKNLIKWPRKFYQKGIMMKLRIYLIFKGHHVVMAFFCSIFRFKHNNNFMNLYTKTTPFNADTYTPVQLYLSIRNNYRKTCLLESNDYHSRSESKSFIGFNPKAVKKYYCYN